MPYEGRQPDSYGRPRHNRARWRDGRGRGENERRGSGKQYGASFHGMNHMDAPGPGSYTVGKGTSQRRNNHRTANDSRGLKRKFVPGGRIPKKNKPRGHEGQANDFRCDSCGTYFPCASSKATHLASKTHRDVLEELKKREAIESRPGYEKEQKELENARKESIKQERTKTFMSHEESTKLAEDMFNNPHAKSFHSWAARSMSLPKQKGEPLGPIQREITHTYAFHVDRGSLLTTTWTTQPLATGRRYKNEAPEEIRDVILTEKQVAEMMKAAPSSAISTPRAELSTLAESVGTRGSASVNIPTATATPVPGEHEAIDVDADIVPINPTVLLRKTNITWKMSSAAHTLMTYSQAEANQLEVVHKFYQRHQNITKKNQDSPLPQRVPEDVRMKLQAQFGDFKALKESGDYETEEFIPSLNSFVKEVESHGGLKRLVRETLSMIVELALESDIDEYHEETCDALEKIMQQFQSMEDSNDDLSEFISHWLVSQLFKRAKYPANDGSHLDIVLASIPKFFYKTQGMEYGLNAIKSVLNGNHVRFTEILRSHPIHRVLEGRTSYMLEPIQDFMRQKAFMLLGKIAPAQGFKVYKTRFPLEALMDQLNYFEIELDMDDENGGENREGAGNEKKTYLREGALEDLKKAGLELHTDESGEYLKGIPADTKVKFNNVMDVRAACSFLHHKNRLALCVKAE